jgi:hypothetical protein
MQRKEIPEALKDAVFTDDRSMVEVEYTLPGYGGAKSWVSVERALTGEAHGRWKIMRKPKQYDDKMMTAGSPPDSLTRDDLFSNGTYETKGVKKKRIAWVQDLVIRGGAEISNELVIKTGIECGFKIRSVVQSASCLLMESIFGECDFIVLNNIWAFTSEQMRLIGKSVRDKPYIKYEHDHRELGRPEFSKELFLNSKLNVFLSPVHLKNYSERLGIDGVCLPLAIDVDFFSPARDVERRPGTALICNVRHLRTWDDLQKYVNEHPEVHFTVMANGAIKVKGDNVVTRPMIPYEGMPKLYSEFEYLVHIMDGWGAGERVFFEGMLCGCKVVSNRKVGHTSWSGQESVGWIVDFKDTDGLREWLRRAPYQFWKEVDKRIS